MSRRSTLSLWATLDLPWPNEKHVARSDGTTNLACNIRCAVACLSCIAARNSQEPTQIRNEKAKLVNRKAPRGARGPGGIACRVRGTIVVTKKKRSTLKRQALHHPGVPCTYHTNPPVLARIGTSNHDGYVDSTSSQDLQITPRCACKVWRKSSRGDPFRRQRIPPHRTRRPQSMCQCPGYPRRSHVNAKITF